MSLVLNYLASEWQRLESDPAQNMTGTSVRKRPQPPSLERQIDMLRSPAFLVNPH
jgi:hypothetical protein